MLKVHNLAEYSASMSDSSSFPNESANHTIVSDLCVITDLGAINYEGSLPNRHARFYNGEIVNYASRPYNASITHDCIVSDVHPVLNDRFPRAFATTIKKWSKQLANDRAAANMRGPVEFTSPDF